MSANHLDCDLRSTDAKQSDILRTSIAHQSSLSPILKHDVTARRRVIAGEAEPSLSPPSALSQPSLGVTPLPIAHSALPSGEPLTQSLQCFTETVSVIQSFSDWELPSKQTSDVLNRTFNPIINYLDLNIKTLEIGFKPVLHILFISPAVCLSLLGFD